MNYRTTDPKAKALENQAREARNAYARKWRAKNPDKVRQYNADYWARKAMREKAGEQYA